MVEDEWSVAMVATVKSVMMKLFHDGFELKFKIFVIKFLKIRCWFG
jgi:hypothetical protein